MKKIFTFFIAALVSASIFAAKDEVPSDAVLADYYNQGEVCVCFFVPAEMNCNNIVVVGSFNGWNSTPSECAQVQPVEGYDGWYVCSFEAEAEPDAEKGMQAKPVMLDVDGNFNWEYQIGAATAIRGGVQVVQGSFAGEIDLINYGTDAPNVFQLNSWKENPCTAIYHNYTITVISDGCEGKAVPFIIGGMNNWTFTQMLLDNAKTAEYGVPTYYASFKAAEGTPYQIVSGMMDAQGVVPAEGDSAAAWNDIAYMQKLVDDVWGRIPGEDGDNQLTHEDANIVWDLRADSLRWARCAPAEQSEYTYVTIKVPSCSSEAPVLVGSFNNWDLATAIPMTLTNDYTYTCSVLASADDEFKVAGSINGWDNQIAVYNETNGTWEDTPNNRIGEQTEVFVDYSDNTRYKWSFCEDIVTTKTYDFEKDGCYYNILSISDRTVQLTCKGDENDAYNNHIATYSGDFRVPETVEYSNRTFTVTSIHPLAFINCNLGTLTIPATVQEVDNFVYKNMGLSGTFRNLVIEDSENPIKCVRALVVGDVTNSVYLGRNIAGQQYGMIVYNGGSYNSITFGNDVSYLYYTCQSCQNLTSVTLPISVKEIGWAFAYCSNLRTITGEGVETMYSAFAGSGIETINMPNLKMMNGDFYGCTSLQTYNIPDGAISLGEGLFTNATSLTSVYIPSTVISMGQYCFSGCTALQTISVANPYPIEINENNFDALTYLNATLKVPVGSKTKYENAPVWSNFLNIVEDPSLVATYATVAIYEDYYNGSVNYAFSEEGSIYQESEWSTKYNIVPIGCTMTITVQPQENYLLSSLTVNGEDVTANVVNNEYSIVINGSATFSINAQFEYNYTPGPQGEYVSIVYVDKDSEYIDSQSVTLYLPEAPEIEGFTFVGWQPVAAIIEDAITIQAIYEANNPTDAPEVYTNPANAVQKLIREGNVYVLYGDKTYTLIGQEIQ